MKQLSLWQFLAGVGLFMGVIIFAGWLYSGKRKLVVIIKNIRFGFGETRWWR